jgi:hypothetical protein
MDGSAKLCYFRVRSEKVRLRDAENEVQMVRKNLNVTQTREKSYAVKRRRDLSIVIGDFVYLKVSPMRGTRRFKVKGKLVPRYVGPLKVIDNKGEDLRWLCHKD